MDDVKNDENKIKQELNIDFMKLLYEDDSVSIAECLLLHEGVNRNKCNISHDVILDALPTIANKPIWGIPNRDFMRSSSNDFVEHARTKQDENNIIIFGMFPESAVKDAEFIEMNNKIYLKVKAVLYKLYAPIAMNILEKRNDNTKISIEINVTGTEDDNGIFNVTKMEFLSATCLGADIMEGIENSQLNIVRFSLNDETIKETNEHYLSFSSNEYEIPIIIKNNVEQALELKKKYKRGMTSKETAISKYLLKNKYASKEKVNNIIKYFSNHEINENDKKNISNKYISWLGFGGDASLKWTNSIIKNNKKEGKPLEKKVFVAKELLGTKDAIKINKSKDALSDDSWSDEGLAKDCLMASNYKELVKAVFQKLGDKYLEGIEGDLGYPVMQKKGNEVVYNRKALASAKAYATKNNETEVLEKLKKIYKHLGLDWEDTDVKKEDNSKEKTEEIKECDNKANIEKDEKQENEESKKVDNSLKFSLTSNQMFEIFNNAVESMKYFDGYCECPKYWAIDFNATVVYLQDGEEWKTYQVPYTINGTKVVLDLDSKQQVINNGFTILGQEQLVQTNKKEEKIKNDECDEEIDIEDNNNDEEESEEMEDFKQKYADSQKENETLKNALEKYKKDEEERVAKEKRADEEKQMNSMLQQYSHCLNDDETKEMKNSIEKSSFADFSKKMDDKIKAFALKVKEDKEKAEAEKNKEKEEEKKEDNAFKFSISPFGFEGFADLSKEKKDENGLDSIIEKSGVKIK